MKTWILFAGLTIASSSLFAQDITPAQVPAAVTASFHKQYSNTTKVKWEKKKELYEVAFEIDKINHKVRLDATGKIVRHKVDIKHTELPTPVQKAIAAKYAGFKLKDPEKVEEGGKVTYKVELKKDKDKKEVDLAADGTVISDKKKD